MRRILDEQIGKGRDVIGSMEHVVTGFIREAIASFVENDRERADQSKKSEGAVDLLYAEVDELCLRVMATQQPSGHDLLFFVSTMKISAQLEQMADQANFIAHQVKKGRIHSDNELYRTSVESIRKMGEFVENMLGDALRIYESGDLTRIPELFVQDDVVKQLYRDTLESMKTMEPSRDDDYQQLLQLGDIVNHLRSMAKRTVVIAKLVHFMVTGTKYTAK